MKRPPAKKFNVGDRVVRRGETEIMRVLAVGDYYVRVGPTGGAFVLRAELLEHAPPRKKAKRPGIRRERQEG